MQSYLTVSVRRQGDSAVVEVGGELDLASSGELDRALQLAWRQRPELVVIDLGDLYFVDMAGLRVLAEARQQAAERGSRLVLARVRRPVQRILELARMGDMFMIEQNNA